MPTPASPFATLAYLVQTPHPFLIRFGGNFGIRYYGLAYLAGFLVAGWLLRCYHRAGRTPLDATASTDLMLALVLGVMAGGRLGSYFFYDGWRSFAEDPLGIFKVWQGGMASHGGIIGVIVALWWFSRRHRIGFLHLSDLVVSTAPAGLLFGRMANFLNGELWGKVTDVPWAMIFSATGGGDQPRHPSQLYEAALEGALLLAYFQWRFWRTDVAARQPGRIAGEFLIGYAIVRIFCEIYRAPDVFADGQSSLLFGLSRGTFFSLFMILAGLIVVFFAPKNKAPP